MIAWLDGSTGVSGDKFLGALLDAGFSAEALADTLAALDLGDFDLHIERVTRGGMGATHVTVEPAEHVHARSWRDIRGLLESAPLPDPVRTRALAAFVLLAEAEAAVHGCAVDDVHFHEVGAVDSIVDVVGVAAGLHALGIAQLTVNVLATGSGSVETAHGTLPVPAPATARLLVGLPVAATAQPGELTTPTGAALVRAFAAGFGPLPPMVVASVGYGAGTRELPGAPNVLPLFAGAPSEGPSGTTSETVAVLETNVDHLSAEQLAWVADRLLEAGALDVWRTPVVMKKGRLATAVSVMCAPADGERLGGMLMEQTSSLGVRRSLVERAVAPRRSAEVETSLGRVRVKAARLGGRVRVRPEHDDVAAIAAREGLPYDEVVRRVTAEAEDRYRW